MPNRVLRDWTTSESIDKLSLGAEVFFTRLIMKADDYGNYTANYKLLKAALFPLREHNEAQVAVWVDECIEAGIIKKYNVSGKEFLNIPNFGQRLRAMKSQYPDIGQSNDGHVSDNGRPETKRNEVETKPETKREALAVDVRDFEWFKKQIDEIWTDQLPTDKKKNLEAAIQNAWEYLSADSLRLKVIDSAGCKQLVSKSFQFMDKRPEGKRETPGFRKLVDLTKL